MVHLYFDLLIYVSVLLSCEELITAAEENGLQYVQIVFRHGDRSPLKLYPTDPNPRSFWVEGLGKLTKLGRKQSYAVGQSLHQRYEDFITTNPNEIDVKSSIVNRCLMSAECMAASFYAPSKEWAFQTKLSWQPVSIYHFPEGADKYLRIDEKCPRANEEKQRIIESSEGQVIINLYKELFKNLTVHSGAEISDWDSASALFDTLKIERKYNLKKSSWEDLYWDELQIISDMSPYWSYNSKLFQRLRGGPLLGLILDNMMLKASGGNIEKKVHLFSGHDSTLGILMVALGIYNWVLPPYCASLIFELHQLNGSYFVRLLYLNSSAPEVRMELPHVLTVNGCSEYCPLDVFVKFTSDLIPEDWETECKTQGIWPTGEYLKDINVTLALCALATLLIILNW